MQRCLDLVTLQLLFTDLVKCLTFLQTEIFYLNRQIFLEIILLILLSITIIPLKMLTNLMLLWVLLFFKPLEDLQDLLESIYQVQIHQLYPWKMQRLLQITSKTVETHLMQDFFLILLVYSMIIKANIYSLV